MSKLFTKFFIGLLLFVAVGWVVLEFEKNWSIPTVEVESVRAQEAENQAQSETRATFGAVGDIVLSRNVAAKINKAKNPLLPFSKLSSLLQENDFNFANLESPFSGKDTFAASPSMVFNAPRPNIKGLVANKFKILSIANNHALDQGVKALGYTRTYLAQNDIKAIGAGSNLDQAWQPEVVEANGIKISFIAASYASINDNGKSANKLVARIEDLGKLKSAIIAAKKQSDWVVVSMHAGTEYKYQPNASQTKFARAAIDFGADMVIGGHPHWVETIEKYKDKYIFYSLGNFIFDQEWSRETKEGLMLKIELARPSAQASGGLAQSGREGVMRTRLSQIELLPIVIENYSTPRLANDKEAKAILGHIGVKDRILK